MVKPTMCMFSCLVLMALTMTYCAAKCPSSVCDCSGTSLICHKWDSNLLTLVPRSTTSLTITGTVTDSLTSALLPSRPLPQLSTLNLTGNSITGVDAGWFAVTVFPSLQELTLDDNNMTFAIATTFTNISTELTALSLVGGLLENTTAASNLGDALNKASFPNLRSLRLDDNNIGLLEMTFFRSAQLYRLNKLSMSNSQIIAIQNNTFLPEFLPELHDLDLSRNKITSVDKNVIRDLDSFANLTVDLSANPFFCNCRLRDLQAWLRSNATAAVPAHRKELLCATTGRQVLTAELRCPGDLDRIDVENELVPSYIILSVILALVGLLALVVLYMRRNDIRDYFVHMYVTTKEAFNNHQGYDDINRVRRDMPEIAPTDV